MAENLLSETDNQPLIDPNKDYFAELVGPDKKFKDPQILARSKMESDLYIKQLERARDEDREAYMKLNEEYNARAKLQELIDKMSALPQQQTSNEQPIVKDVQRPGVDPNEIASLVSNKIQEYESTKRQTENFNQVRDRLKERFGDNFQGAFRQQMEQLGLTEEDTNALARKSPAAFYKTFGLDASAQRESFQSPARSTTRIDNFSPRERQRTWTYYQELKNKDFNLYQNPKTQVQMHHDRIELGEAFKDGDYSKYGD